MTDYSDQNTDFDDATRQIGTRLCALVSAMSTRNLIRPDADLSVNMDGKIVVTTQHRHPSGDYSDGLNLHRGDTVEDAFAAAWEWIKALPTADEAAAANVIRKGEDYRRALDDLSDEAAAKVGRETALAQIAATTKALSENVLPAPKAHSA